MPEEKSTGRPSCIRCEAGGVDCAYDESALAAQSDHPVASTTQVPPSGSTSQGRTSEVGGMEPHLEPSLVRHTSQEKGHISVYDGGRSAYVGSTFWANAIPSEFNRTEAFETPTPPGEPSPFPRFPPRNQDEGLEWIGQKFRPPRNSDFAWTKTSSNKCRLCGKNYNISCVMALLPTREICEKLCGFFFETVFPLTPILHMRSFAEDFRAFWNGVDEENMHDSQASLLLRRKPGFLALLSAILFAALASASQYRLKTLLGDHTDLNPGDIYFIAMASATLTGFPRRPSIYSLAAYIIAQSQFVREEEFSDSPDFIATAFRIALGMGLHRQLPDSGFTVADLETRRRLWWYIIHLDVMSSSSSGLSPLFINQKMASTDPICQYDAKEGDERFASHNIDIRYLVATHRYEITREIREVLVHHFEDSFQSPGAVNACANRLRMIADRTSATIDTLLKVRTNAETRQSSSSNSTTPRAREQPPTLKPFDRVWTLNTNPEDKEIIGFSAWSALLLHLMVHKAFCVLYHPLFRDSALMAHDIIRTNAVKHAQAFIQLFIRVCNDPISEPFHWMYPGTYQPLQAVSLLLADLLQHPYSDNAALSRGLIDAIFELYQVDEGIVSQNDPPRRQLSPSGREAWTMLVRTRRKALEQVGMDHHVLFPSAVVSSSTCICGERIDDNGNDARGAQTVQSRREQQQQQQITGGELQLDPPPQQITQQQGLVSEDPTAVATPMPGQMLIDHVDFDWHAWDNALGPSVGLMP